MPAQLLTVSQLREVLDYDPETGVFIWRKHRFPELVGTEAGTLSVRLGYIVIRVKGTLYYAHRLAWLYSHGEWPDQIDHANHDRADNRLSNLKSVPLQKNRKNLTRHAGNRSGQTGVRWSASKGKWRAYIQSGKQWEYLGYYDDFEIAVNIRKTEEWMRGFHTNHGEEK